MPGFPMGGAAVSAPVPLYPDYVSNVVFVIGGNSVALNPFSGPKGSPFDALMYPPGTYQPTLSQRVPNTTDHSTGALSTGIGFDTIDNGCLGAGPNNTYGKAGIDTGNIIVTTGGTTKGIPANGPGAINGFSDDYIPGTTLPSGALATLAILTAIGGGKSTTPTAASSYSAPTVPYNVQPLLDMGVGGSRDAGAGPAFTGFSMKLVTATSACAQGVAIEAGFVNRTAPAASGVQLLTGVSAFGSSTVASAAVT